MTAPMNTANPIQIFKTGRHTAMSGASLEFSQGDLEATVAAYDPNLHEAPLVVGHPKSDAPAYGWVGSLTVGPSGFLEALPRQVDPAFSEMVANGRFKKVSASFYTPASPGNPRPGVYYLRHVGFLGAQAPAVKGLRPPKFADHGADVVTIAFGERRHQTNSATFEPPPGYHVNPADLAEYNRIAAFAERQDISFADAVSVTPRPFEPPPGYDVNPADLARHARIAAFAEGNGMSYTDAVMVLEG